MGSRVLRVQLYAVNTSYCLILLGKTHPIPPWIEAIFCALDCFVIRVIDPAVRVILQAESDGGKVFFCEFYMKRMTVIAEI